MTYDVCVQGLAVGDHELKLVFAAPECREHMAFVYKYGLKITGEPRSLEFQNIIATIFSGLTPAFLISLANIFFCLQSLSITNLDKYELFYARSF